MSDFQNKLKATVKNPIFWARFLGYAIPLSFLLYVLYINFLPFGYHKTFTITVGGPDDTKVSEFYLEPATTLSERKTSADGTPYRELNGIATAVFKPKAVLNGAEINVSVEGEGVSIIPPTIDFKPEEVTWDYSWDFTKQIPKDLKGNAFVFDGATYFDGNARLEMPSSSDKFEDGPFTVYAEWLPIDETGDAQQIIGHYNWELWQNKDTVSFQIGRMNDVEGIIYRIQLPITKDFYNTKHSAIAIYNPGENGYAELWIDNQFVNRVNFGTNKIWKDYNGNKNLTLGWTPHNYEKSPYFKGGLYHTGIIFKNLLPTEARISFILADSNSEKISIVSYTTTTVSNLKLDATKK
jgi:hypothetical protein